MPHAASTYTDEIATVICERLADGESLNAICKSLGSPSESTVRRWALEDFCGFAAKYTRAREIQADTLVEQILDISDDSSGDIANPMAVQRDRLRTDNRKWFASKVLPKRYGERVDVEHAGTVNHTISTVLEAIDGRSRRLPERLE